MVADQKTRIKTIVEILREKTKMDNSKRWDQYKDSANLAYFLWVRWGKTFEGAHSAWCRLMQYDCSLSSFEKLVKKSEYYGSNSKDE